jgi:hypothetical protein
MIRAFWLGTTCLAVLSALAIGKAVQKVVAEKPTDQTTVGTGLAQDALSKADRLEVNYVARNEILPQPAVPPTVSIVPAVSSDPPPVEMPFVISRKAQTSKQTGTNTRAKRLTATAVKPQMVLNRQNR